ncbi:formate dehydrogenase accessory sulfurtransferase FdhD [Limnoglobus roseus]|uniref:Sulfur carrier protein FdhD n=1 Tax=Limnoglobus roseus TaxID=2598579 RepID=A0A5C1ABF0_9BACT|nr:formate dehydrogenase accessory sulfurtransferase FdhD [Limnoglobus roseus]QEL16040.1 formate dehydrogenase accessory sulfurtransferase FdhD [Limnoglobus roseus]
MRPLPTFTTSVVAVHGTTATAKDDQLALEEPLEIRLGHGPANNRQRANIAVTMRTPGHDAELAVGYLVSEGLLTDPADLLAVVPMDANVIRVDVKPGVRLNLDRLERRGVMASSCGVCGKTTLDAIEANIDFTLPAGPRVAASVIHSLPAKLHAAQPTFAATGGLHAVGLFDANGELRSLREDVGRHNAADKVIGGEFLAGRFPLHAGILFVSARASFELVQKAAVAGVPFFAAVGAPSSLAVQTAERFGLTLLGFVRDGRFNIYAGRQRIDFTAEVT